MSRLTFFALAWFLGIVLFTMIILAVIILGVSDAHVNAISLVATSLQFLSITIWAYLFFSDGTFTFDGVHPILSSVILTILALSTIVIAYTSSRICTFPPYLSCEFTKAFLYLDILLLMICLAAVVASVWEYVLLNSRHRRLQVLLDVQTPRRQGSDHSVARVELGIIPNDRFTQPPSRNSPRIFSPSQRRETVTTLSVSQAIISKGFTGDPNVRKPPQAAFCSLPSASPSVGEPSGHSAGGSTRKC